MVGRDTGLRAPTVEDAKAEILEATGRFFDAGVLAKAIALLDGDRLEQDCARLYASLDRDLLTAAELQTEAAATLERRIFADGANRGPGAAALILAHSSLESMVFDITVAVARAAPETVSDVVEIPLSLLAESLANADGDAIIDYAISRHLESQATTTGKWRARIKSAKKSLQIADHHLSLGEVEWQILEQGRVARNVIAHAGGTVRARDTAEVGGTKLFGHGVGERLRITVAHIDEFLSSARLLAVSLGTAAMARLEVIDRQRHGAQGITQ